MGDIEQHGIVFVCSMENCAFMEDGGWEIFRGCPQWCPNCGGDVVYLH